MITVDISGGLGNQMFQYAFARLLEKHNKDVLLCTKSFELPSWERLKGKGNDVQFYNKNFHIHKYFLEDIFDVRAKYADIAQKKKYPLGLLNRLNFTGHGYIPKNAVYEESFTAQDYDDEKYLSIDDGFLVGFWQYYSLYDEISDELKKAFAFKKPLNEKNLKIAQEISSTNSVSVHIRRGDFLNNPEIYPELGSNYYIEAMDIIKKTQGNLKIFCFSDDISWCKENLPFEDITFVDWNLKEDNYIDMQLMSLCRHNIIANSTFSGWAAFLNENPEKIVVSPKRFNYLNEPCGIDNFLPESWIKI